MEWFNDFSHFSTIQESLYEVLPRLPPPTTKPQEWTCSVDNSFFENALAGIETTFPALVLHEVETVQSGNVPVPDYSTEEVLSKPSPAKKGKPNKGKEVKTKKPRKPYCRGLRWTEDEHILFLMGLNKYGKGAWRGIAMNYVITKTPIQVASHAQKYYRRLNSSTPPSRRRPSINDVIIDTANPSITADDARSSSAFDVPRFRHGYGFGAGVLEQIPPLFIPANAYQNQPSSFFFGSFMNQQWG